MGGGDLIIHHEVKCSPYTLYTCICMFLLKIEGFLVFWGEGGCGVFCGGGGNIILYTGCLMFGKYGTVFGHE